MPGAFNKLRSFAAFIEGKLNREYFELRERDLLARCVGRRCLESISIASIASWRITPEMGMDVITLQKNDGSCLAWFDKKDDLIALLRRVAPEKEKSERVQD